LISSALITLFFSLFARTFLGIDERMRVANWLFRVLIYATSANVIGSFFLPYDISARFSVALAVLVSLAMLAVGLAMAARVTVTRVISSRPGFCFLRGHGPAAEPYRSFASQFLDTVRGGNRRRRPGIAIYLRPW